jgi:hypothetical protein
MPNLHPKHEHLRKWDFQPKGKITEPLAKKNTSAKLYQSDAEYIKEIRDQGGDVSGFIRDAVREAVLKAKNKDGET